MSFITAALSAGNLVKLRGDASTNPTWDGDFLLCVDPCTTVLAARVNGALVGTRASITYDTVTSGAYTSVEVDQVVIVSHTSSKLDYYWRGRVRKTPTSTIIYTDEDSISIDDNDYIWVLNTYDITDRLSRPVDLVQYKDYELAYAGLQPVIRGLQTGYAGYTTSGKLRIAFGASTSYAAESGATISSYAYTFPSGTTVISGSAATATVTIDFDPGWYWFKLVVTDSGGRTQTRHVAVAACDPTSYPVDTGFDAGQIARDENGHSLSIPAFTGVSAVLDNTFCIGWTQEWYNGTEGPIINTVNFVGWTKHEDDDQLADETYTVQSQSNLEIIGIGGQMARLQMQLLALRNVASPDEWDEITNLTPWRGIVHMLQRHSTVLNLCDLSFDDVTDVFLFPYITTQGGNLYAATSGIAAQINASLEFNPDGKLQVVREAGYLSSAERAALITVADWNTTDILEVREAKDQTDTVGKVDADGAFYFSANASTTALRARAPYHAVGSSEGSQSLNNQILLADPNPDSFVLTTQAELNQRAGNAYSIANDTEELTVIHPAGYHWLAPSKGQLFTFTLDGTEAVRGLTYTTATKWMVKRVTVGHNPETGQRQVEATYANLTGIGSPGVTVPSTADGEIELAIPDMMLPAFDFELPEMTFPDIGLLPSEFTPAMAALPKGKTAKVDGSTLIIHSTARVMLVTDLIALRTPHVRDITPPSLGSFTVRAVLFDPGNSGSSATGANQRAYVLVSDGTNSKVYSTTNVFNAAPTWTASNTFAGTYTGLRATGTPGTLEVYSPTDGASQWTYTFNFLTSDGGFVQGSLTRNPFATWVNGTGWVAVDDLDGSSFHRHEIFRAKRTFASTTLTGISTTFDYTKGSYNANEPAYELGVNASQVVTVLRDDSTNGTNKTLSWTGSIPSVTSVDFTIITDRANPGAFTSMGSGVAKSLTLTGLGANPFGGSATTGACIRVSSDYGATFGSAVDVGNTPGVTGGFDTQRAGTVQYAAADNQVKIATTVGGAFSNASGGGLSADPVTIVQPYFTWGSNTARNTTGATPDYITLTNAAGSSLKRITGAGTVVDVTPVAGFTGTFANAVTTLYGTHAAAVGTVSGTQKLYVTANVGNATPTWIFISNLTNCTFIRVRRGDTRALQGGNNGQLFVVSSGNIYYTSKWGANGIFVRTMPITVVGFDILG